ncbi:MAG: YicC family protein [Acidobacteriia bacterium]|nr:YicC family protein [Terriglobia bacterium]
MILSMTGFGQGQVKGGDFVITISLKSVNHRHFDATFRMPQELQPFENELKNLLKEKLIRGAIIVNVIMDSAGEVPIRINAPLAAAYLRAANEIKDKFNINSELNLDSILRLPNVVTFGNGDLASNEQLKEKFHAALEQALEKAVSEMLTMRSLEGKQLENDVRGRTGVIGQHVDAIEKALESNVQAIFDKLKDEVMRLTQSASLDPARLAQEVAYLAEKSDVTEEVTRLKSHVKQFLAMLDGEGEIGKRLDFLLQEMHREANTILSKTTSAFGGARDASDRALEIKAEIEKLREQVQNVV